MKTGFNDVHWYSEDHQAFAEMTERFYRDAITPHIESWCKAGIVDREIWAKAGDVGILGACAPEEFGGSAAPRSFDALSVYNHACTGDTSWGFAVHNILMHYIMVYGTDDQKETWLPRLVAGDAVGAIAMTEPGTGSDLQSIRTVAVKDGGHYVINGSKTFISNGGSADLVCVVARTGENGRGPGAVSLFVVDTTDLEGFRRGRLLDKIGMRGQDTSELFFDDVCVPETSLLGGIEGRGFYQLMEQLSWERLLIAIAALGSIHHAIALSLQYSKERKAFGQRVFDFQNTRFKLADCVSKSEMLRAFVSHCVNLLDQGRLDPATASMAKLTSTQVQGEIVDECLQLFGGYGFMVEYPISRAFVDARVQKIYGGTNEIMKELIARSLDG